MTWFRRLRSRLSVFDGHRGGAAAVEFAFVIPVVFLLVGATVELGGAFTAGVRATRVAETIGQVVSQTQAALSEADLSAIIKTAALVDPDIAAYAKATGKSLETAANVTISSVAFKLKDAACTASCAYDGYVVFSEALAGPKRSCGKLAADSSGSPAGIPSDVVSANSVVAVDVEVFYRPLMTSFLGSQISFKRSLYFRPRYVDQVNYAKNCAGFPVVSNPSPFANTAFG